MFWFPDLRRSIVELLLSETASPAELCRRYNIASGQFYTWKKQYAQGRLDPEPSREVELEAIVCELERLLGKVTLENGFLEKVLKDSLKQTEKKRVHCPKQSPLKSIVRGRELMDLPRRTYYYKPKA